MFEQKLPISKMDPKLSQYSLQKLFVATLNRLQLLKKTIPHLLLVRHDDDDDDDDYDYDDDDDGDDDDAKIS